jgi:hypothetical protein
MLKLYSENLLQNVLNDKFANSEYTQAIFYQTKGEEGGEREEEAKRKGKIIIFANKLSVASLSPRRSSQLQ